jgi:cytosine/adenosine deaminase-related metal-dependent hydrolase
MFDWLRRNQGRAEARGLSEAQSLISAYGAALERSGGILGREADLPTSKETLKQTIKAVWQATDDQKMRDVLGTGFVQLAIFRQEPPPEPDMSNPEAVLSDLVSFERHADELARSNAEMNELLREWQEFVAANY